jgi:preprotein translocase subunit SecG
MLFLNIIYVLLAVGMIVLILMQRGAGAQAGSGFGGGASGTVFGARGSANFLSKSTKWLAVAFFVLSLAISMSISKEAAKPDTGNGSIMAQVPAAPAPSAGGAVPAAPVAAPSVVPSAAPSPSAPSQPATTTPESPSTGG